MSQYIINLDNAATLLRLTRYEALLNEAEKAKLDDAIFASIQKIDLNNGSPGFDTEAAFQEFFGRPCIEYNR